MRPGSRLSARRIARLHPLTAMAAGAAVIRLAFGTVALSSGFVHLARSAADGHACRRARPRPAAANAAGP